MMGNLRVSVLSLNQIPLDWDGNLARIRSGLSKAQAQQADVVCFPELCLSGYGCEDQFFQVNTWEQCLARLKAIAPQVGREICLLGLPMPLDGKCYNVVAIVHQGQISAFIPKQFLANDGLHYEARWFTPWPAGRLAQVEMDGKSIPFGDYQIHFQGHVLGIEICQDAWEGPLRPAHALAKKGVNIICNPTASHAALGKAQQRIALVQEGAKIIHGLYLFANLLGNESGRAIFDGDLYIAQEGRLLAENQRYAFQEVVDLCMDVDLPPAKYLLGPHLLHINQDAGQNLPALPPISTPKHWNKEEEFAHLLALGLWDYLRKSKSNGGVLSLSGGADSSSILCLCALSLRLAHASLGMDGLKASLSYIPGIESFKDERALFHFLMTTLYQGTVHSSEATRASASALAQALGSEHHELELDQVLGAYHGLIAHALGRSLTWEQDDIALQNIQARLRSPSAWMLANIKGALLLATSNRSEASVGYATMDGDTSGSISPIAGIDKPFVRHWLRWMETEGLDGFNIPALHGVNHLEPSAELRPLDRVQQDEKDLMPYALLNDLERWAFYERLRPKECLSKALEKYAKQHSVEELQGYVRRYFRLWAQNQWKRERYAPAFHISDYSLDPKSWLRFPILSAGLEKDI